MAMEIDEPRISLPGFGHPVNSLSEWSRTGEQNRLPHAIADYFASDGITVRERRMLDFMNQITDKPEWTRKVFDEKIVANWKEEGVRWDESLPGNGDWWLSETMFAACMEELKEKANEYEEKGSVAILDAEATIVKSDTVVSTELRDELKEAVHPLEDVPDRLKDWHPGSEDKVLDLVHPSLFPVVFGLSRALPTGCVPLKDCISFIGKGETIPDFSAMEHVRYGAWGDSQPVEHAWGSYQWLPTSIKFDNDGSPIIDSYINNLHPRRHSKLYSVLENFVDASIPLWNECLSWFHSRIRIDIGATSNEDYETPEGVKFPRKQYRQIDENYDPSESDKEEEEDMTDENWAWENDCIDEYQEWAVENMKLVQPEPTHIPQKEMRERDGARPIDLRKDFKDRGLQVIFKLANIHLTPEHPTYDGGSWHVEGSLNEHICATALYYYDCENVTESRLAFRQSYNTENMIMKPAQSEYRSCEAFYGIEQDGSTILELGSVVTRQDRLLAFPNVLQHQVQPFELADKTKPGHRKILAMFLIDPHIPVLSTANVPPQRRDWWAEEVRKIECFAKLPEELFEIIIEGVEDFPISWEKALKIRERLMYERGLSDDAIDTMMTNDTFFFCEH